MKRARRQVSLLRGINVGSINRISMPRLLEIYAGLGGQDAVTHLQSGNVILRHAQPPETVSRLAEAAIRDGLGLSVSVIGRTHAELDEALRDGTYRGARGNQRFVVFLSGAPPNGAEEGLRAVTTPREHLHLVGRELHMHLEDGIGRSRLTLALIERRLGVTGTARNWNTVEKLAELSA